MAEQPSRCKTFSWTVSELQEALSASIHDVQMVLTYLSSRTDLDQSRIGALLTMSHILRELCRPYGVTVNGPAVVAVPPGVAMAIRPVIAPSGTVAVTFEVKFAVKPVALTPPKRWRSRPGD